MRIRWGLYGAVLVILLIAGGGAFPARVHLPLAPGVAQAQTDCDGDGDGDQDLNEYGECFEPPPVPDHPFRDEQKQFFRQMVWDAWNTCTATGHPLPAPIELPGPPNPGVTQLPSRVLQTYYTILSNQFAATCGDLGAAGVYAASMLSVDPPDPDAAVIPVPRAALVPQLFVGRCRALAPRRRALCRRFATAAFSYAASVKRATALAEAMAVAGNRFANEKLASANFNTAVSASAVAVGDLVAEHAYAGELASALDAIHRSGLVLANTLRRLRLDARFTARQLRSMRHALSTLRGLPNGFVSGLRHDALDPKAIEAMLAQQLAQAKVAPFDLITLLRRRLPTTPLITAYGSTTVSQLADLVAALTAEGVASREVNIALNDDLQNAALAVTTPPRIAEMEQFVADSKRLLTGPYSTLLQIAAEPLTR
jgi:hypothetical protein